MGLRDKVVYQIYPKSFQDSNSDGWGDIKGIISRLDYLQKLGINYIWFNPMIVSPQRDNGYDVADYRNFDPRYGTMEDFEELSREAAKRGIGLMFDMVFNHTSTEHEWFKKAMEGDEKYKKYYIFRKGKGPGVPPNNWQSKFAGPAWEYVEKFDEWYLHLFDVTQADLDWTNPEVRQECADIVNYWIGKGVHGFRFDVINLISKASFEDDPNNYDGRQFYTDGPKEHEYLQELNRNSFGNDPVHLTVGEMSSTTIANCVRYANLDGRELDMVFSFHHLKVDYKNQMKWELQPMDFMRLKELFTDWQVGMQEADAWNALFWNCHDQPRSISRFGNDKEYRKESGKMLATALHMMRGTPYIYQGEEIGMPNAYFTDISQYVDVESTNIFKVLKEQGKSEEEIYHILQERSRDNARTPMQWDDSPNAGFTDGTPWIQVADSYKTVNVKSTLEDPDSIFVHYQKLIQMRKTLPVVQEGVYIPMLRDHPKVYAYERKTDDDSLIVVSNFFPEETAADVCLDGYEVYLSNYSDSKAENHLVLRPYESVIFRKKA
ncbi:MAG: alpha,alpha-phosphotrehalase [Erysipelotrichaceae bacterium]|nr:alpha,alpha-phosphotrehalase [Erysipelotrichaceae bacterium]MDO5110007.1 alpha,alpha-phosphotrehalase [Erysipelotrichaceae bacterium]